MSEVLIEVEGVSKKFCRSLKRSMWYGLQDMAFEALGRGGAHDRLRHNEFWAVDGVSFQLRRGECLGLVGRNGAGKTTLLKMLNGLIKPDKGSIRMRGRIGALIALGAGFNPILTGRENIYINASVLGLTRREVDAKIDEIIDFAEIRDFIDAPVQSYSSGMAVRLGFAVATALDPDVLLLDEVLAVGDASFQAKCHQRLGTLLERAAVILVSHQAWHIMKICNTALLLQSGRLVEMGSPETVLQRYAQTTQGSEAPRSLVLCGQAVRESAVEPIDTHLPYGGRLSFRLHLELEAPVRCDLAKANIVDSTEAVHAQVMLHDLEDVIPAGRSRIRVTVGPLHLPRGSYNINLLLCGAGGKTTLAHLRHCCAFTADGPQGLGAVYYPPSTAEFETLPEPAVSSQAT